MFEQPKQNKTECMEQIHNIYEQPKQKQTKVKNAWNQIQYVKIQLKSDLIK